MIYGLWQSAAGLQAQEYRQAIIANNLANADTPGFRADRISFQERLTAAASTSGPGVRHPVLDGMTGGLFETQVYTDFSGESSTIVPSNNPLDVAVEGDGFLVVQTADGPRYTRDGQMVVDRTGALVQAATGRPMLDAQGQTIAVDAASGQPIRIDPTGVVRQGAGVAGRLALVDFADRQQLEKVGQNLFAGGEMQPIEGDGRIRQSCYESSGVDAVQALVEMIASTRVFEANARMIAWQDESLGRVVNDVGRLS